MEKKIYREENFRTSRWSGGKTTELAIFPDTAQYIERDFIWRLSSASVETDESVFTKLTDYDRILMVIDGEAVLVHGEEGSVSLSRFQQDSFDGGIKTKCFGRITDYNLMMKKGCDGNLSVFSLKNEPVRLTRHSQTEDGREMSEISYGVYCLDGHTIVSLCGEADMLKRGEQMVINFQEGETEDIVLMGEGTCIVSEVRYEISEHIPEVIPEEKATLEDFKTAFKLVCSRNKWNKIRQKNGNANVWYDEALQAKLKRLDRIYLTFFIWVAGVILSIVPTVFGAPVTAVIATVIAWTVIHILLISPLIYMAVLPKPIKAHIKNIDELTEYERKIYEAQRGEDEQLEKLLRKYKEHDEEEETYRDKFKSIFK